MIDDLIYDVGMNNGDDTAYYLNCGYRVVAIEANPLLCEQAARRFAKDISSGRLQILNVGIAGEAGKTEFWICDSHSEWSSFLRDVASRDGSAHHPVTIECERFGNILARYGVPYYLKVDIEGHDQFCINELTPLTLPRYISFENNKYSLEMLEYCHRIGYRWFKLISQFNFLPLQRTPDPMVQQLLDIERMLQNSSLSARLMRVLRGGRKRLRKDYKSLQVSALKMADWTFVKGSSGPFGENTRGVWQTYEEILSTASYFRENFKEYPSLFHDIRDYSFWCDYHVRLA